MTGGKRIIPVIALFLLMGALLGSQWVQWGRFSLIGNQQGRFSLTSPDEQGEGNQGEPSPLYPDEQGEGNQGEPSPLYPDEQIEGNQREPSPLYPEDPVESAAATAVIVESGELRGSGNIWKAERSCITIITAAHVIDDEKDVTVTLPDGQTYRAEMKLNDKNNDYCFLEVRDNGLSLSSGLNCAENLPAASESVFLVVLSRPSDDGMAEQTGQNEEIETTVSAGVVISPETYSEDLSRNVLCCDIEVAEGMSGGGLFDAKGNYLGLLLGRSAEGLGIFIPVSDIEQ